MEEEEQAVELSSEAIVSLLTNSLIAIVIGAVGYFLSVMVARLVFNLSRRFLDQTLASFISAVVRIGVLIFTFKLILDQTGAAGILVILVTAFTGAFALGSERIAGDLVAGFNLFFLRFYRVGDLVTITDFQGRITAVSLTHTTLDNGERDLIIIPNSEILSQTIVNHSSIPGTILRATVRIMGEHDRGEIVKRILAASASFEPQLRGPDNAPEVVLEDVNFAEGEMISTYLVMIYAPDDIYEDSTELLLHIMRTLDEEDRASAPVAA